MYGQESIWKAKSESFLSFLILSDQGREKTYMTSLVEETSSAILIVYTVTDLRGPKCGPRLIVPDPEQAKDENKLDA